MASRRMGGGRKREKVALEGWQPVELFARPPADLLVRMPAVVLTAVLSHILPRTKLLVWLLVVWPEWLLLSCVRCRQLGLW